MILKEAVNYGGRLYGAGENVKGKLPLEFIELLNKNGKLLTDGSEQEEIEKRPLWLTVEGKVISVEQFEDLKADDQKALLKALEIDPDNKGENRIVQYEDWFAEQVHAGDQDDQL
ncbi:hypothetical protein D3C76_51800 [compost metagenome]